MMKDLCEQKGNPLYLRGVGIYMLRSGIEPESNAWKALMLTITPTQLVAMLVGIFRSYR